MAQQQWTVPGYGGVPYNVGLYHGVKTGHLLVQCNGKILIIDFGVTKSKDYSFMLGEELYELEINKEGSQFEYIFKHNEEIETPHNIRRIKTKKTDKNRLWAAIIVLAILIIGIFGVRFYWSNLENNIRTRLAKGEGQLTEARLLKERDQWMLIYKINDQLIKQQLLAEDTVSAYGFPLQTGDRYQVRILPKYKYIYLLDWTSADEQILQRFIKQAFLVHQTQHPELAQRQALCHVKIAYSLEGLEGIAKFYNQAFEDSPIYNKNAYFRLVRGIEFRMQEGTCL